MGHSVGVPKLSDGAFYISEGGVETEIMYRHGFSFPHFCAFELLKDPNAMNALDSMYRDYFDVVRSHKVSALVGGLDYRSSPDWGELLGYSPSDLEDINHQCIEFLRNMSEKYGSDIDSIIIQGYIGPRGDAYQRNDTMTAKEAEDYHAVQLQTLKSADIDIAAAITLNNVEEAIGIARAARAIEMPLYISFSLTSNSMVTPNQSLREAIERVDTETGKSVEFFIINCVHPIEYEPALESEGAWINRIRGVRPNASKMDKISLCKIGHLEEGNPVELGQQVAELVERYPHMDIVGGCCGTWDRHLDQIARQIAAIA